MMETMARVVGLCLVTAVAVSLLRREAAELGLVLALAAVLLSGALVLGAASDAAALGGELAALSGLSGEQLASLAKVTAIALIARIGGAVCADAGQSALARVIDAAGAFCALGCALPLLRELLALVRGWL